MIQSAQSRMQNELDAREKLSWAGVPQQGIVFRSSDFFLIPFSLLWGGFAIFWEILAITIPTQDAGAIAIIFPIFGIPFVVVGLYIIFGRFIYDSRRRSKTFYGVTNERAIIISGGLGRSVKSINLKTMSDLTLSEKSDRRGTITFGQERKLLSILMGRGFNFMPGMGGPGLPKFELIDNASQVYKQLRAQQKA